MRVFFYILYPFALIYDFITRVRNVLFNKQFILKSASFEVPVVCVGNLTVGGTGKTPMIEFLLYNLADSYKIAVLSRGYGRSTKGYFKVNSDSSAKTVGDEPFQMFSRFGNKVSFFVCENRVEGISNLLKSGDFNLVLLDDAFQHRYVKPTCSILLTSHNRLFVTDFVLPMGRLRESRNGANRADLVVVTKCPQLSTSDELNITNQIKKYTKPETHIYFSKINYLPVKVVEGNLPTIASVVVLTGIAQPEIFLKWVREKYEVVKEFIFSDHYNFTKENISEIKSLLNSQPNCFLLTTEKDTQRLLPFKDVLKESNWGYLPIESQIEHADLFLKQITDRI